MALLIYGNSYNNQDLYYETHFLAEGFTYISSGKKVILIPEMEVPRARSEASVEKVVTLEELGYRDKLKRLDRKDAYAECVKSLVKKLGLNNLTVSPDLPAFLYKILSEEFVLEMDRSIFEEKRRKKNLEEIKEIRKALKAAEESINLVKDILGKSKTESTKNSSKLFFKGKKLDVKTLRKRIEHKLVDYGCETLDIIVAPGINSYNPHWRGSGFVKKREPLILDIFPRFKKSRYCGDITRTFAVEGGSKIKKMYKTVKKTIEIVEKKIEPGMKCSKIQEMAENFIEENGFKSTKNEGFTHSIGHGIGLDVHEKPFLSSESDDKLKEGDVFTLEPGLYYKDVGGVRIEDVYQTTSNDCKKLTSIERELMP